MQGGRREGGRREGVKEARYWEGEEIWRRGGMKRKGNKELR